MENCVFCKVIKGEFDCAKIWEDENFLAFLNLSPNVKGMTLVIPKNHHDSYAFDMPEDDFRDLLSASRKVAKILERELNVKRVGMVMEGLGVNHAHIKLYPLHGLRDKFQENLAKERIFFDRYEGYLSTQMGPQKDISDLKKLADEIRKN